MTEAGADAVRVVPVDAETLRKNYGFVTPTPTEGMFAVVGAWGSREASPFVALNGHIDTVPAAPGWTTDPLGARGHRRLDERSGIGRYEGGAPRRYCRRRAGESRRAPCAPTSKCNLCPTRKTAAGPERSPVRMSCCRRSAFPILRSSASRQALRSRRVKLAVGQSPILFRACRRTPT